MIILSTVHMRQVWKLEHYVEYCFQLFPLLTVNKNNNLRQKRQLYYTKCDLISIVRHSKMNSRMDNKLFNTLNWIPEWITNYLEIYSDCLQFWVHPNAYIKFWSHVWKCTGILHVGHYTVHLISAARPADWSWSTGGSGHLHSTSELLPPKKIYKN